MQAILRPKQQTQSPQSECGCSISQKPHLRQSLASAEREAGRILGDAGLNVVWLNCPLGQTTVNPTDPCQQPLDSSHMIVRLLSDRTRKGFQDSVFGFAILPALASVYAVHLILGAERLVGHDELRNHLALSSPAVFFT